MEHEPQCREVLSHHPHTVARAPSARLLHILEASEQFRKEGRLSENSTSGFMTFVRDLVRVLGKDTGREDLLAPASLTKLGLETIQHLAPAATCERTAWGSLQGQPMN